jgi:biotin carboxyl carrier protein
VFSRLLVANRGEIAVRIARAAADLGIASVAVHATDEPDAPHVAKADAAVALRGAGVAAYLDIDDLLRAAEQSGADAVHPGYGFRSGMRRVTDPATLADALARCASEAGAAIGDDRVYAEELLRPARHVEVQILGDGTGAVIQLGERDCSVQRRHQKVVEVAPAPGLDPEVRAGLHAAAVRLGESVRYAGLGTVEFLVAGERFAFIEVNPRVQVEHTITEEVTGVDLVATQIRLAAGARALSEVNIAGVGTNVDLLAGIVAHPAFAAGELTTDFLDDHRAEVLAATRPHRFVAAPTGTDAGPAVSPGPGEDAVTADAPGTVVSVEVASGDTVRAGQTLAVLEAMKMEHVVAAPAAGTVGTVAVNAGDTVAAGDAGSCSPPTTPSPRTPSRRAPSTPTTSGPTSPRSSSATRPAATRREPRPSTSATAPACAPPGRTSRNSATRAASSSTGLADVGSVLELRAGFGRGIVTALVRVEGRPMGLIANDPAHLGGAIDHDAADKAARFLQLCDAFGLRVVSLCDTPGFMVGPESETHATVRHVSRMFSVGGNPSVPLGLVVTRKCYGLGAQAMMGGSLRAPAFAVSWPTGEFGGMGLEGAVRLGYRKELDAAPDPAARQELYERRVAAEYEKGRALSVAQVYEIDDVIDPADTRRWIASSFVAHPVGPPAEKRRPNVDTW